jgi:hypothetical protein
LVNLRWVQEEYAERFGSASPQLAVIYAEQASSLFYTGLAAL